MNSNRKLFRRSALRGAARKPLPHVLKNTGTKSEDISVPQKLLEAGAYVKTEDWVTKEQVLELLEVDAKGKFELVRDSEKGNPKMVLTVKSTDGEKFEFIFEIPKYPPVKKKERKVSEILDETGVVPEKILERIQLIEDTGEVALYVMKPFLVEDTLSVVLDRDVKREKTGHRFRLTLPYESSLKIAYNAINRDPNFMSDPADLIKDDCF